MKKIITVLTLALLALSSVSAFAETCVDRYQQSKWLPIELRPSNTSVGVVTNAAVGSLGGTIVGTITGATIIQSGGAAMVTAAMTTVAASAIVGASIVPATLLVVGSTAYIHNIKPRRMIKLIKQADLYVQTGVAENLLQNVYESSHQSVDFDEFAKIISNGNRDLSLCQGKLLSVRDIKNGEL